MQSDTIADAASVILLRRKGRGQQVLMGQRGANAAFMPQKFVFPGGRVDDEDFRAPAPDLLAARCRMALSAQLRPAAPQGLAGALIRAALRETAEETGLTLARMGADALRFAFRAITPPGRTRRFDARFFIANACDFDGDSDQFSGASGELSALQWLDLDAARALDLPFITRVILAEVTAMAQGAPWPQAVPFFDNSGDVPIFSRL